MTTTSTAMAVQINTVQEEVIARLGAGGRSALRAFERHAERLIDAAVSTVAEGVSIDDRTAAQLLVSLCDPLVRDLASDHVVDDDAVAAEQLWRDLVARAPRDFLPAPAALLAMSAWYRGDLGTAATALELCLRTDPGYRMGLLLQALVRVGVPADELAASARARSREERRADIRRAGGGRRPLPSRAGRPSRAGAFAERTGSGTARLAHTGRRP